MPERTQNRHDKKQQHVEKAIDAEVAYLVWEAKPFVNVATDMLVMRGGKIGAQTFTAG